MGTRSHCPDALAHAGPAAPDQPRGLKSHLPPPRAFDSGLEAAFFQKFGARRGGWTLQREGAILHEGQTTFVPDFAFCHEDGTEVLFEIVGFWTPEYLEQKRATLRRFAGHRILLAVPKRSLKPGAAPGPHVIVYGTALKIEPVLEALERIRTGQQDKQAG